MKFVHVATRTQDLDRAIAFYELLGMRCRDKKELTKNKATLAFVEPAEGNFAIEVENADETYATLVAAGADSVREPALLQGVGPSKIAFVADPDGNWIELIQRDAA
jgi:catechol 2,3-dioxygenase-like lactoylglutathione lyase family enzyme